MYFVILMVYVAFAQVKVFNPECDNCAFSVEFSLQEHSGRGYWAISRANSTPLDKELMNGVTSLGKRCAGRVKGGRFTSVNVANCPLVSGESYKLTLMVVNGDKAQRFSSQIDLESNRRRLSTPSMAPVTSSPTVTPSTSGLGADSTPSFHPTRAPHTSSPTAGHNSISPSMSPIGTSAPSAFQTASPTTAAPVVTTAIVVEEEEDDSTFLGFDMDNGSDVGLMIFVIFAFIAIFFFVLLGPKVYRRYKSSDLMEKKIESPRNVEVSKATVVSESIINVIDDAKMEKMWAETDSKIFRDPVE